MTRAMVYVEIGQGTITGSSYELLHAGRSLVGKDGTVDAVLAGHDVGDMVASLGAADRVITVEHPALETYLPDAQLAVLVAAVREHQPDIVLLAYTSVGLDLAAAAAFLTDRPLVSYCTALHLVGHDVEAVSQLYGGKLNATVRAPLPAVFAVTPGSYDEDAGRIAGSPEVEVMPAPESLSDLRMRVVESMVPDSGDVDITQADRILCVGRGIGDADRIAEAETLAKLLGAEIAGSRPVIDNGWLPKARQVGKSGAKVKPKLYLCAGVSGAPEHLEGMKNSELIIAVNSDPAAPIFNVAHYGTTSDLFDLLPALEERLKSGGT